MEADGGTFTFNDDVTLTADVTLTDSGDTGITFGGTVDMNSVTNSLVLSTTSPATSQFSASSTLDIQLDGTAGAGVAGGHTQVQVTGGIDVTGSTLTGMLGFTPPDGTDFIIIDNDGTDAVTGTFNGLAEGAMITIGDYEFTVTYRGIDGTTGNDVVLLDATPSASADTTVSLDTGVLTITDSNGGDSNDALTISHNGSDTYTITDGGGLLITTGIAGATGDGTATVTIPDTGVTGINFDVQGGDDSVTVESVQASLSSGFTITGGTGTDTATVNGDIVTTGSGAVNITVSGNIALNSGSSLTTVDGGITLSANQQTTPTVGDFRGIEANNATIQTTGNGNIQLLGLGAESGGDTDTRYGVNLLAGTSVSSTATGASAGTITINGVGGDGVGFNMGALFQGNGTDVTSVDGDISISGTGGNGSGNSNRGVVIENDVPVQVANGMLTVNGTATAGNSRGVWLNQASGGQLISVGAGNIIVTADGSGTQPDFRAGADSIIGGSSATGDITINADTIEWSDTLSVEADGALTIQPRTANTTIGLGGGAGTLNLDDTELGFLQDGFSSITIGDTTNGTGDVDIDSATFTDPVTLSGGTINDNAGTDITAPSVTLDGNVSPGQSPGQLVVSGDLTFASGETLTIEIDGTAGAGVAGGHDQVAVTGAVTLNDAVLMGTLNFTPTTGDDFIIIDNDGTADAVSGTFNGLTEGAMITIGDHEFTLRYGGGDGNDVVLEDATPLAVTLALFETEADSDSILIRWQTVSEQDNLGFNLYRATEIDGSFGQSQLNSELIAAQAPGSGQGAEYEWLDTTVEGGSTYFYWLEDVDVDGNTTMHGPISAAANEATAVTTGALSTQSRSELPALALLMLTLLTGGWLLRRRQR